jgi:hypothetical protein
MSNPAISTLHTQKQEIIARCTYICDEIEKILVDLFLMRLELEFGEIPIFPDDTSSDQMDFVGGPIVFSPMESDDESITSVLLDPDDTSSTFSSFSYTHCHY